jgi:hypothetical protein
MATEQQLEALAQINELFEENGIEYWLYRLRPGRRAAAWSLAATFG